MIRILNCWHMSISLDKDSRKDCIFTSGFLNWGRKYHFFILSEVLIHYGSMHWLEWIRTWTKRTLQFIFWISEKAIEFWSPKWWSKSALLSLKAIWCYWGLRRLHDIVLGESLSKLDTRGSKCLEHWLWLEKILREATEV